jgi:hypothetical protein
MMNSGLNQTLIALILLLTAIRPVGVPIVNSVTGRWKSGRGRCVWEGWWMTLLVIVAHWPLKLSCRRLAERNDWASQYGFKGREKSDIFRNASPSLSENGIKRRGDPLEP